MQQQQNIIEVYTFSWMKKITAKNNGKKYQMIGEVRGVEHTLLVSLVDGNGGAVMFFQTHSFAYPIKGSCEECRNAVVPVAVDASVTSCDTPEFER